MFAYRAVNHFSDHLEAGLLPISDDGSSSNDGFKDITEQLKNSLQPPKKKNAGTKYDQKFAVTFTDISRIVMQEDAEVVREAQLIRLQNSTINYHDGYDSDGQEQIRFVQALPEEYAPLATVAGPTAAGGALGAGHRADNLAAKKLHKQPEGASEPVLRVASALVPFTSFSTWFLATNQKLLKRIDVELKELDHWQREQQSINASHNNSNRKISFKTSFKT
jgi:hypothetical protein